MGDYTGHNPRRKYQIPHPKKLPSHKTLIQFVPNIRLFVVEQLSNILEFIYYTSFRSRFIPTDSDPELIFEATQNQLLTIALKYHHVTSSLYAPCYKKKIKELNEIMSSNNQVRFEVAIIDGLKRQKLRVQALFNWNHLCNDLTKR